MEARVGSKAIGPAGDPGILDGTVIGDTAVDQEIQRLTDENRRLRRQLSDTEIARDRAVEDASRALGALRRQLSPLYRALQAVFGELDAAGVEDVAVPAPAVPGSPAATAPVDWAAWKQKFGPTSAPARILQAIEEHGPLNQTQLKTAAKLGSTSVFESCKRLVNLSILEKRADGRYGPRTA